MTDTKPTPADPYPDAEALLRPGMDDWDDEDGEEAPPAEAEQPEPKDETSKALADDDGEDSEAAPAAPAGKAEVEKARSAAKYAKLPESLIASMSEADLLEWHSGWAKNDADVKRAFRENADLRRELEKFQATKTAEPAVPTAVEDQELTKIFTEELGAERGKAIAARLAARDAQVFSKVQALESVLEKRLADSAWEKVRDRLGIKDEAARELVVEQARALSELKSGPWVSLQGDARVDALFVAAARMVDPNLPSEAEIRRRAVREEARRNGSPTAAPQRAAPKVPKTFEEIQDARLREIIFKGTRDTEKLRRIGT